MTNKTQTTVARLLVVSSLLAIAHQSRALQNHNNNHINSLNSLININDNQELTQYEQHNNIVTFEVAENAPNNTFVGIISSKEVTLPFIIIPNPKKQNHIPEHELKQALHINSLGEIHTNSVLDREKRDKYIFVAIPNRGPEIQCTVHVRDVNDNSPYFILAPNESLFRVEIPEATPNARASLPAAIDHDVGLNSIREFRIVDGNTNDAFRLVEHRAPSLASLGGTLPGADDESLSPRIEQHPVLKQQSSEQVLVVSQTTQSNEKHYIDLEVNKPLDRENQSSYQLMIEVIDSGTPPLSGRLMVTVRLQDMNDNPPVFGQKQYECQVPEDAPENYMLIRVQAQDADLEANGTVNYFIKRHTTSSGIVLTPPSATNQTSSYASNNNKHQRPSNNNNNFDMNPLFTISQTKGEIYLARQLDFETDQWHELLIEARDQGRPASSSESVVKIFVMNVNDAPAPPPQHVTSGVEDGKRGNHMNPPSSLLPSTSETPRPEQGEFGRRFGDVAITQSVNVFHWFAQMNPPLVFVFVLVILVLAAFPVCLVRAKSRQPKSNYDDGLALSSNSVQSKLSPQNSTNNEHSISSNDNHHHRHDGHQWRTNPNGIFGNPDVHLGPFASSNAKGGAHYNSSSNLYFNLNSRFSGHLDPTGGGAAGVGVSSQRLLPTAGSRGGTLTLRNHQLSGSPNSPPLHHFAHLTNNNNSLHSSSLTYAHHHSRAAAHHLHHAHHHQSSHHLSAVHQNLNQGGTMNSAITLPHQVISLPNTPNLVNGSSGGGGSGLPTMHSLHAGGGHLMHQCDLRASRGLLPLPPGHGGSGCSGLGQLPTTPHSTIAGGCMLWSYPPAAMNSNGGGGSGLATGSSSEVGGSTPAVERWSDLGVPSQLIYAHDLYGSYNWDYLADWAPEFKSMTPIEACS